MAASSRGVRSQFAPGRRFRPGEPGEYWLAGAEPSARVVVGLATRSRGEMYQDGVIDANRGGKRTGSGGCDSTLLLMVLLAVAAVAWLADQLPDESGLWGIEREANTEADRIEMQVQAMRRVAEHYSLSGAKAVMLLAQVIQEYAARVGCGGIVGSGQPGKRPE
jgi:hypothetical protein